MYKIILKVFNKPWLLYDFLLYILLLPINILYLLFWRVDFKMPILFFGIPIVRKNTGSKISIGKNFEVRNSSIFNIAGISHPVCLATISSKALIKIADNVGISGGSIVAMEEINIGNGVLIGANCLIIDNDFHPINSPDRRFSQKNISSAPINIEDNVFIGANSIILKGVTIAKNSVIGAGSVVTKDVSENSIVAGNPAKEIGKIEI